MSQNVQSVERALSLLSALGRFPDGTGVRELARQTKLSPSTAHALLKTLVSMGYVEFIPRTRKYRVGKMVFALGMTMGHEIYAVLGRQTQELLERVRDEVDETVSLFGMVSGHVVSMGFAEADHQLAMPACAVGLFVPQPHLMACGKVLLACGDRKGEPELPPEKLKAADKIRELGYAAIRNLESSGRAAVAVPIAGVHGKASFALGVSMHKARHTEHREAEILRVLLHYAPMISTRLQEREQE